MYAARNAEIKSSHDGSKNILRRFGRGTQKHAITISPWLDLIPNGDYTSALCGSLKIAFSVKMNSRRIAMRTNDGTGGPSHERKENNDYRNLL